jgi:hypothetical protein
MNMDNRAKELIASTDDEHLQVFVRSCPHELSKDDLELVAGGKRSKIVPNG